MTSFDIYAKIMFHCSSFMIMGLCSMFQLFSKFILFTFCTTLSRFTRLEIKLNRIITITCGRTKNEEQGTNSEACEENQQKTKKTQKIEDEEKL